MMDVQESFAQRIRDLERRIQAENASRHENRSVLVRKDSVRKPSLDIPAPSSPEETRKAQTPAMPKTTPFAFDLASPSMTRKKPKPLTMNHSTVGPALGRAMTPDMNLENIPEPSLLGFRDSFRLTRQRRLELASSSMPPGVYTNATRLSQEDHSIEYEEKLGQILKKTNIITLRGVKYESTVDDLENMGELGHGTCGTVVKMRFRKTGDVLAVKIMRKSGNQEENKRIIRDLDVVLKSHDCPHIVRCLGCFVTDSEVWICMEMMTTCLDKLLRHTKMPVPERILGKMTVSVVKALHYLKEKHGVIHRDVKPSNILLDSKGNFKLCDFGISGRLVDSKAKTRCAGCAAYMAPERIVCPTDANRPDYDIRADVWSMGISLIELATCELPYKGCKTDFEVLTKILDEDAPSLPTHQGFSMDFCSFVKDCLIKDYKRRPKYRKLMEHPFVVRYELLNVDVAAWVKQVYQPLAPLLAQWQAPSPSAPSLIPEQPQGDQLAKARVPSLPKSVPPIKRPSFFTRPSVEAHQEGISESNGLPNIADGLSASVPTSTPVTKPTPAKTTAGAFSGPRSMIQQMAASASAGVQKPAWLVKQAARSLLQRPNAATVPPSKVPMVPSSAPLPRKQYNAV